MPDPSFVLAFGGFGYPDVLLPNTNAKVEAAKSAVGPGMPTYVVGLTFSPTSGLGTVPGAISIPGASGSAYVTWTTGAGQPPGTKVTCYGEHVNSDPPPNSIFDQMDVYWGVKEIFILAPRNIHRDQEFELVVSCEPAAPEDLEISLAVTGVAAPHVNCPATCTIPEGETSVIVPFTTDDYPVEGDDAIFTATLEDLSDSDTSIWRDDPTPVSADWTPKNGSGQWCSPSSPAKAEVTISLDAEAPTDLTFIPSVRDGQGSVVTGFIYPSYVEIEKKEDSVQFEIERTNTNPPSGLVLRLYCAELDNWAEDYPIIAANP